MKGMKHTLLLKQDYFIIKNRHSNQMIPYRDVKMYHLHRFQHKNPVPGQGLVMQSFSLHILLKDSTDLSLHQDDCSVQDVSNFIYILKRYGVKEIKSQAVSGYGYVYIDGVDALPIFSMKKIREDHSFHIRFLSHLRNTSFKEIQCFNEIKYRCLI